MLFPINIEPDLEPFSSMPQLAPLIETSGKDAPPLRIIKSGLKPLCSADSLSKSKQTSSLSSEFEEYLNKPDLSLLFPNTHA